MFHAVDGSEIAANQLRLAVYLIIYKVLYIPHGAGFLPSTVCSHVLVKKLIILFELNLNFCRLNNSPLTASLAAKLDISLLPLLERSSQ